MVVDRLNAASVLRNMNRDTSSLFPSYPGPLDMGIGRGGERDRDAASAQRRAAEMDRMLNRVERSKGGTVDPSRGQNPGFSAEEIARYNNQRPLDTLEDRVREGERVRDGGVGVTRERERPPRERETPRERESVISPVLPEGENDREREREREGGRERESTQLAQFRRVAERARQRENERQNERQRVMERERERAIPVPPSLGVSGSMRVQATATTTTASGASGASGAFDTPNAPSAKRGQAIRDAREREASTIAALTQTRKKLADTRIKQYRLPTRTEYNADMIDPMLDQCNAQVEKYLRTIRRLVKMPSLSLSLPLSLSPSLPLSLSLVKMLDSHNGADPGYETQPFPWDTNTNRRQGLSGYTRDNPNLLADVPEEDIP
ncbi:hypothetical protein KIPB_006667 [Kipferlia bialata]|uniref:Uncharacterized protein n=1 Tax=Kipferlia bialata TaxID=797122 RepID=A0A9K3CYW3_9EUKA|nr:hypothetical protein KIPB_006667 [Kipferlia bialata]|eukprot:g6667.t1